MLVLFGERISNASVSVGRAIGTVWPAWGKAAGASLLKSVEVITIDEKPPVPTNII